MMVPDGVRPQLQRTAIEVVRCFLLALEILEIQKICELFIGPTLCNGVRPCLQKSKTEI